MAIPVNPPQEIKDKHRKKYAGDKFDPTLKRKGWVTPYGFIDLKEPATYEEACEIMKPIHEAFLKRNEEEKTNEKT